MLEKPLPSQPAPATGRRGWPWRLLAFQAVLTAALIAVGVRLVDLGEVIEAIRRANLWAALPALTLFTLAKFVDAFRWRFLLREVGALPQRALFGAFLIGNMLNNLLPFRFGDVAKIQVLANRYGVSRAGIAASVFIVEATLDGVTFTMLVLAALLFWDLAIFEGATRVAIVVLAIVSTIAFLLAIGLSRHLLDLAARLPWRPLRRALGVADSMQRGLHALGSRDRVLIALALSLPSWLIEALMFWVLGDAFGFDLGYSVYLAVMVAANLAVAVPVTLWNIGTYQLLVVAVLVPSGVDEASALAYALAAQVLVSAWIQLTGIAAFWLMRVHAGELVAISRRGAMGDGG